MTFEGIGLQISFLSSLPDLFPIRASQSPGCLFFPRFNLKLRGRREKMATPGDLPPEAIAFAIRMYNAARAGQMDIFQQALPAGLPANMMNDKGDSLVCHSIC